MPKPSRSDILVAVRLLQDQALEMEDLVEGDTSGSWSRDQLALRRVCDWLGEEAGPPCRSGPSIINGQRVSFFLVKADAEARAATLTQEHEMPYKARILKGHGWVVCGAHGVVYDVDGKVAKGVFRA